RLLHTFDHRDCIRSGLAPNFERDRRLSVQANRGALFLRSIFGPTDVPDANRRAVDRRYNEIIEVAWVGHAPHGPYISFDCSRGDVTSRLVGVLPHDRIAHRIDGELICRQSVRIDPDIYGALQTPVDSDLADTGAAFKLLPDDFVRQLRQFAQRTIADQCDRYRWILIAVVFNDGGRLCIRGQQSNYS